MGLGGRSGEVTLARLAGVRGPGGWEVAKPRADSVGWGPCATHVHEVAFPASTEFSRPGRRVLLGSCRELPAPGPRWGVYFREKTDYPHLGAVSEGSGGGGDGVPPAGSAQVREAGLGPDAGRPAARCSFVTYGRPGAPGFPPPGAGAEPGPLMALPARAEEGKNQGPPPLLWLLGPSPLPAGAESGEPSPRLSR